MVEFTGRLRRPSLVFPLECPCLRGGLVGWALGSLRLSARLTRWCYYCERRRGPWTAATAQGAVEEPGSMVLGLQIDCWLWSCWFLKELFGGGSRMSRSVALCGNMSDLL